MSAKRVRMSICRSTGCHPTNAAERNSLYRWASSATAAGMGGTPSVTRFSLGATVATAAAVVACVAGAP